MQAIPVRFDTEAVHQVVSLPKLTGSWPRRANHVGASFYAEDGAVGKAKTAIANEDRRPMPPADLGQDVSGPLIVPAVGLRDWAIKTFVEEDGRLFNIEHKHLLFADLEFLWAATTFQRQGRTLIGLCEQVSFRVSGWPRWRQEQQFAEWFGRVPDFVITLAADYCREAGDAGFCALTEHELYHVGHKHDAFGDPEFTQEGLPKLFLRGHDVEEFVGVVRRYGVGDPDSSLARLVKAACGKPEVSPIQLQHACGTCVG